jgi:chaperonin GroES
MKKQEFKLVPVRDHIIITPLIENEDTGGIFVGDEAREKPQRGIVLAVGSGRVIDNGEVVKLEVKIGDTVIYSKYGGMEIKIKEDKQSYLILTEDDILAIDKGEVK